MRRRNGIFGLPARCMAGLFLLGSLPVNTIRVDDLDGAVKVEAYIQMLLCHAGTVGKKTRINKSPWMPIPESVHIPGQAGQGPPDREYQYMRYPRVEIPLKFVRQGDNTFEFTCSRGTSLGGWWPQRILYGVTFRVYYDDGFPPCSGKGFRPDEPGGVPHKPHPTGSIIEPCPGTAIGESAVFQAPASGPRAIRQVDSIGCYEDFNWEGDGNYLNGTTVICTIKPRTGLLKSWLAS